MPGATTGDDDLQYSVSPFVEVSLTQSDSSQRTSTATGPNPYWNEELILPFKYVCTYSTCTMYSIMWCFKTEVCSVDTE